MGFLDVLRRQPCAQATLPAFIHRVDENRGVRILRLQGDVGKSIGKEVQQAETAADNAGDYGKNVLFDFAHVTVCDFSTVSYLVNSVRKHAGRSTRLGIINAGPHLRAELEISKLESILECFSSEDDALEALARTSE
jgi:anti-anti-sigma regulatory factor